MRTGFWKAAGLPDRQEVPIQTTEQCYKKHLNSRLELLYPIPGRFTRKPAPIIAPKLLQIYEFFSLTGCAERIWSQNLRTPIPLSYLFRCQNTPENFGPLFPPVPMLRAHIFEEYHGPLLRKDGIQFAIRVRPADKPENPGYPPCGFIPSFRVVQSSFPSSTRARRAMGSPITLK